MRKLLFSLIIISSLFSFTFLYGQEPEIMDTVSSYSQALKSGDIGKIKQLITGKFYETNRVLLEENPNYPSFLRKHYDGSKSRILEITHAKDSAHAKIEISFIDGRSEFFIIYLRRVAQNKWKIFAETQVGE